MWKIFFYSFMSIYSFIFTDWFCFMHHFYLLSCFAVIMCFFSFRSAWSCTRSILHSSFCLRPESPDVQPEMCSWGKLSVKVDCCQDLSTWREREKKQGLQPSLSVIQRELSHNNHLKCLWVRAAQWNHEVKLTESCHWWWRGVEWWISVNFNHSLPEKRKPEW